MKALRYWAPALAGLVATLSTPTVQAFPGFFATKKGQDAKSYTTQVVVMKKAGKTAVSVMTDYEGPLDPFAVVLIVPADVSLERVAALKREFVDRVDQVSAPRFQEFWEQDPCDPGPTEQEWQRSLKVQGSGFLGGDMPVVTKRVAKELFLDVQAKQKQGEYAFTVLKPGESVVEWLKAKGLIAPKGAAEAVAPYLQAGLRAVVAEVDTKRIELVGGERAQLSPIRFWTEQAYDTVPNRIGLVNAPAAPGQQELLLFTIDPEQRYEVGNYKTSFAPTNIEVDFSVKERMGEFYNALYDLILAKTPNTFLAEYTWPTEGCGQPCATEPLLLHELLSLGGDMFDSFLPEAERHPKPPELTKEEKEALKAELKLLKPKERKQKEKDMREERQTIAERQAMVARHKYIVSRLHYRYDAKSLPQDPKLVTASSQIEGGTALPKGIKKEVSTELKVASASKHQTRFNNFHPWVPVIHCPNPERYRWGKSPPDYRGLRKIWIAEDLSRKSHTQIKPAGVVLTPLPALGLAGGELPADAGADAGSPAETEKKPGCSIAQTGRGHFPGSWLGIVAVLGFRRYFRRTR